MFRGRGASPRRLRWAIGAGLAACALISQASTAAAAPTVGNCQIFPSSAQWNMRVDRLPRLANSTRIVRAIGSSLPIHPDFGSGRWNGGLIGIPYVTVGAGQSPTPVVFDNSRDSDSGPYPIPRDAPVEDRPDKHVVIVDRDNCKLYEMYLARHAEPQAAGLGLLPGGFAWRANQGSTWDMRSSRLRPDGVTSADAAGLPIFPLLTRYDEVAQGEIRHALRLSVPATRKGWIYPARHDDAHGTDPNLPQMGQRFRLKRSIKESRFPAQVRPIIRALKRYGAIVSDQGAPWFLTGAPDERWDMNQVFTIENRLHGRDFEAVNTAPLPRG